MLSFYEGPWRKSLWDESTWNNNQVPCLSENQGLKYYKGLYILYLVQFKRFMDGEICSEQM